MNRLRSFSVGILFLVIGFASIAAFAEKNIRHQTKNDEAKALLESSLKIDKGAKISVESYDAKAKTFEVNIIAEPGVGPNVATTEDLFVAIGLAKNASERLYPNRLIGSQHLLKSELRLQQ